MVGLAKEKDPKLWTVDAFSPVYSALPGSIVVPSPFREVRYPRFVSAGMDLLLEFVAGR